MIMFVSFRFPGWGVTLAAGDLGGAIPAPGERVRANGKMYVVRARTWDLAGRMDVGGELNRLGLDIVLEEVS